MTKLSRFAPIGAGWLVFSVCLGLTSAERAFAQAGGGGNKDVRVINTPAEAVPVAVQSLPAVQITGTPTVNVANTVPVTVTNLPAAPAAPQPITITGNVPINNNSTGGSLNLYTVPADKTLVIEFVSFNCNAEDVGVHHRVGVQVADENNSARNFYFLPDGGFDPPGFSTEVGSKQAQIFGSPGSPVIVFVNRNSVFSGGPGSQIFTNVTMTGHLVDAQ